MKNEIEKILGSNQQGLMVKWQNIQKVLLESGYAYRQEVAPEHFVVHPLNRGGTGINGYNMHAKGSLICNTGADLSQLGGAIAFEVNTSRKKDQIEFTMNLAMQSGGLIAKPSGMERFMTVSKSHTTQVCKAIKANCMTPQVSLAGGDGCLGSHLLVKDESLSTMVNIGWDWTIIQACVEDEFPTLPSLVESACNASNATYEPQNEIQLMSAIIGHISKMKAGEAVDYSLVANELCHGGTVKGYSSSIGKWVQQFAGSCIYLCPYLNWKTCDTSMVLFMNMGSWHVHGLELENMHVLQAWFCS